MNYQQNPYQDQYPNQYPNQYPPQPPMNPIDMELENKKNKYFKKTCNVAGGTSLLLVACQFAMSIFIAIILIVSVFFMIDPTLFSTPRLMSVVMEQVEKIQSNPNFYYLITILVLVFGNLIPALFASKKNHIPIKSLFTKPTTSFPQILMWCMIALGVNALGGFIYNGINMFLSMIGLYAPSPELITDTSDPLTMILMFVVIVIVAPITEEIVFRGILLKSFSKYNTVFAAITTSFLFGILHGNLGQAPSAFFAALLMSYVTIKTGSIIPAIIIHMVNNFLSYTVTMISFSESTFAQVGTFIFSLLAIGCLLATITIIAINYRKISFRSDNPLHEQRNNIIAIQKPYAKFFSSAWIIVFMIYSAFTILAGIFIPLFMRLVQ